MSRFDESLRAVHSLACLRHLDADPQQVSVVFKPLRPDCYPQGAKAPPSVPEDGGPEYGQACHWEAQVRLGPGKWGHSVGPGATPEEALTRLLDGYCEAHNLVDARRDALKTRLIERIGHESNRADSPKGPGFQAQREQGWRDVEKNLRDILDPSDARKLTLDGLLNSVQTLVDERRERGGA